MVAPVLAGAPEAGGAEKADAEETKKPLTAEEKAKRIEEMIDALAEEATRVPAERELTEFGEDAIPHFIKRLGDRKMSAHVGVLLEKLGEPAYQAIAVAMRDESSRNSAAMLMERVGEPAVPYLIEELERIGSRLRAGKALERIGDASVPALMKALRSPVDPKKGRSGWVAVRVVDALAKIGTPKVIDELMKALPDDALRSNAELTLSKLGPVAVNALMQRGLKDSNAAARATSIRLLYRGKVENAFNPILSLFSDTDVKVRREVAYACREYRRKEALPKLIAALKDKDRDVRAAALGAMVAIPDKSAINALVEAMKDVSLRMTAASAIEAMGAAAADHLLVMAKNQDKEIRWQALDALVPLKDVRAIPLFAVALGDKSRRVYLTSASGLRLVGEPATPALIGLLKSPDAIVRRRAADVLFNVKDARALDALVTLLKDKDDDVRVAGARAIIKLRDSRVVPALSAAMKDPNPDVRYQVTRALASVADKRTVPVLIEAMADPRMHQSILLAMERIGLAAESHLTAALDSKDRHIRGQAARCLGRIRIKTAPPKLIATLKDSDRDARKYAAEALGKIRDKSATPGLIQAASDKDASVRYNTVEALITIQDPRAIDTLVRALGDKMTRISAMSALGRIGQESVPALLSELKKSKKVETRRAIVDVLEGLDDPRAIPALVDALADEKIRQSAALSLGRIGKVALPNVVAALKSKDGSTRIGAAIALRDIASADAINAMAKAIKDSEAKVRQNMAMGFGNIGPEASKVVPALSKLLFDDDGDVRYETAIALGKIGDPRAVPDLIDASSDDDVDLVAIRAVEQMADKAIDAIIDGLKNENVLSRSNTVTIMERLRRREFVMPLASSVLNDKEAIIREEAARALGYLKDRRATSALAKAVTDDEDWTVRQAAALSIGDIGDPAGTTALVAALADEEFGVTWNAQRALEKVGIDATLEILEQLKNEDPDVRSRAVKALINLQDERAIPALTKALDDDDGFVRRDSCIALGKIGKPSVIPALIKATKDPSKGVRYRAVEGIAVILNRSPEKQSPGWKPITEEQAAQADVALALFSQLKDDKAWEVRMHSVRGLGNLGIQKAIEQLISALADKHGNVSGEALSSLKKYAGCDGGTDVAEGSLLSQLGAVLSDGPAAKRLQVVEVLRTDSVDMRSWAIMVTNFRKNTDAAVRRSIGATLLGHASYQVSTKVKKLEKTMIAALKDSDAGVRAQAIGVIGYLQKRGLLDKVTPFLKAKERGVRASALRAVGHIFGPLHIHIVTRPVKVVSPPPPDGMIADFILLLGNREARLQVPAQDALIGLGKYAVPALTKAIDSEDSAVRRNALKCLAFIGDSRRTLPVFEAKLKTITSKSDRLLYEWAVVVLGSNDAIMKQPMP